MRILTRYILWEVVSHGVIGTALFTFVRQSHLDPYGHRFFEIVSDVEADDFQDAKLTLWHLQDDHLAWFGAAAASESSRFGI